MKNDSGNADMQPSLCQDTVFSSEQTELAVSLLRTGIWKITYGDQLFHYNQYYASLYGITRPSPVPLAEMVDYWVTTGRTDFPDRYRAFLAGGDLADIIPKELSFTLPGGETVYLKNPHKTLFDASGNPKETIGAIVDFSDTVRALRELTSLQELTLNISRDFIHANDFDVQMNNALRLIGESFQCGRIVLGVLGKDAPELLPRYFWLSSRLPSQVQPNLPIPFCPGSKFFDSFVTEGLPFLKANDAHPEQYEHVPVHEGVRAALALPITAEGHVIGVLELSEPDAYDWKDTEIQAAQLMGNMFSVVFERHRVEAELRAETEKLAVASRVAEAGKERQTVISQISQFFAGDMDEDEMFACALQKLLEYLELNEVYLLKHLPDEESYVVQYGATASGRTPVAMAGEVLPYVLTNLVQERLERGEPISVTDFSSVPKNKGKFFDPDRGSKKFIAVPLLKKDRDFSIICCTSSMPGTWSGDEIDFLQLVANICTTGLDRIDKRNEIIERDHRLQLASRVLETALDSTDSSVYVSDMETDELLLVNQSMEKLYGLTEDVKGRKCWQVLREGFTGRCPFCPKPKLRLDATEPVVWEEYMESGGKYIRHTDKMILWPDGRPVHIQSAFDITDLKMAEQAAERQLGQQSLMADVSTSFISLDDVDAQIAAALEKVGTFLDCDKILVARYEPDEKRVVTQYTWHGPNGSILPDEAAFDFTPGIPDFDALVEQHRPYVKYDDVCENIVTIDDMVYSLPAGIGLTAALVTPYTIDGGFGGVIKYIKPAETYHWTDNEIQLALLISGIYSVVMARNLEAKKLVKAKMDAEAASWAKSIFLSNMSHEIRTPMNAIIGMTQIARGSGDVNKLNDCIHKIEESSRQLLAIINDVLDISKIESGKYELELAPFPLEKTLASTCGFIQDKAESKSIIMDAFFDGCICKDYIGDETRIAQVLTNLLSNAVKFTPVGGKIVIRANETGHEDGKSVLRFSVADTGIGMDEEQLSRVFRAFEQADGSITRKYGGTGLGLPISKSLVEKMGGCMEVTSTLGKGSVFSFWLPLEEADAQNETCAPLEGGGGTFAAMRGLNILALDTDAAQRKQFAFLLERLGLTADFPADGAEARRKIEQAAANGHPYDIIFLDYYAPDTAALSGPPPVSFGDSAVVAVAPFSTWHMRENEAARAGILRYLTKPLFPTPVAELISSILRKQEPEKPTTAAPHDDVPDFSRLRLLLAEDIAINTEIFIAMMEETGAQIDTAADGVEAVEKYMAHPDSYDVIITDIQMPNMNGYDVARTVRGAGFANSADIPIIAMTANAFREDVEKCIAAGMNDHIEKPVIRESIYEKIAKYVDIKKH